MKIWNVKVPIVGYTETEIEADNYNEAIQNGVRKINTQIISSDILDYINELDALTNISEESAYPVEATAECIEDDIY
jgi:hypothetical protein